MKTRIFWSLVVSMFLAATSFAAKRLDPTTASVIATVPIGEVRTLGPTQIPIITWGGDIATILANGNAVSTAPGSIFASQGLNMKLVREDVFVRQIERYIKGESPYLRGTVDQIGWALEVLNRDPRTKPITIYQLTWSRGGDCLVVKSGINTATDLRGKTIAIQANAPQVYYLTKVLSDAGVSLSDVRIMWVKDITGTDESPAAAFREAGVDAAVVISPDAFALSSNGTVGTGAEQSVKGARILLSTKSASRIIADVYVVRQDYFNQRRAEVEKFVHGLLLAEESLAKLMSDGSSRKTEYDAMLAGSAQILLDSSQATEDVKGLYGDCEYVGYRGNVQFFADPTFARRLDVLNKEAQQGLLALNLIGSVNEVAKAGFDYEALKKGLVDTSAVEAPRFRTEEVQKIIGQRADQGTLGNESIFSFEILFKPNQNSFSMETYLPEFKRVTELASTYAGAVITVEGHSDPMQYLRKKQAGESQVVLSQIRQSAKNLSLTRASAVRDAIIEFAAKNGIPLDPSQFAIVGYGISNPKSGLIGNEPRPPASEAEWLSNMRVEFRLVSVEAEDSVFTPL